MEANWIFQGTKTKKGTTVNTYKVTFYDGDTTYVEEIEARNEAHLYAILDSMCEDVEDIEEKIESNRLTGLGFTG